VTALRTTRCSPLLVVALLGLLCGCGGSDEKTPGVPASGKSTAPREQRAEAPKETFQRPNAALARKADDQQDRATYRALVSAGLQSINGYWARTVPGTYGTRYVPPRIFGPYDPSRDVVLCAGQDLGIRGNAFYCPAQNFIAWDEPTFFYPAYKQLAALAPVFILAHEWGHAIQAQLRVRYDRNIEAELGADCLAGAWAEDAAQHGELTREDFDRALDTLIASQDPDEVPWVDPSAHGTAFERTRAFGDGVEGGPTRCIRPAGETAAGATSVGPSAFRSPSGNIGCVVSGSYARCDIREHIWRAPQRPRSCGLDWGYALAIDRRSGGHFLCAGDTTLGAQAVLGYGRRSQRGPFRCTSRVTGMTCRNLHSGHGFSVSRQDRRLF
jgi:uncharacterized protein